MAENSAIEWCDSTFNPWEGCQKVGPGCDHCYAETRNARFGGGTAPNWGPGAPRRRTSPSNWRKPLRWNAEAAAFADAHGRKQRVFCSSLADVFDNAVDPAWRADLFDLIDATPNLDWLLLTKRVGNVADMVRAAGVEALPAQVRLGATVVNQTEAERDIQKLLAAPAASRFLSIEPMLGPIDLTLLRVDHEYLPRSATRDENWGCEPLIGGLGIEMRLWAGEWYLDGGRQPWPKIDWIICGGESGPGARAMHPDWARSLRDQCGAAKTPFLFKQWGEWASVSEVDGPGEHYRFSDGATVRRVGKKRAGRLLDGVTHDGFPA